MKSAVFTFISIVLRSFNVGEAASEPDFASPLENVTIVAGREARLACIVENLDNYKVAFVHYGASGSAVLTVGTHVLTTNRRVSVLAERDSWTLVIANSTVDDRGDYMCQISTVPPKKMYRSLEVQVPPHISLPPNDITVDEGENVTLVCQAMGDPPAKITWKREDGDSLLINDTTVSAEWTGETLFLSSVTRVSSGAHLCVASNGVPPAVSARVQIFVNYPPIMLPNKTQVVWATLGDTKSFLSCGFLAYPKPNVTWSNIDKTAPQQEYEVHTEYSRHDKGTSRLYFRPVLKEHFGQYRCSVVNERGDAYMTANLIEKITTTTSSTTTSTESTSPARDSKNLLLKKSLEIPSSMLQKSAEFEGNLGNGSADNSLAKFFDNLISRAGVFHPEGGASGAVVGPSADFSPPGGINIKQYDLGRMQGDNNDGGETNPPNRFVQDSPLSEMKGRSYSSNEAICGASFDNKQLLHNGIFVVFLTFCTTRMLF